MSGGFSANVS